MFQKMEFYKAFRTFHFYFQWLQRYGPINIILLRHNLQDRFFSSRKEFYLMDIWIQYKTSFSTTMSGFYETSMQHWARTITSLLHNILQVSKNMKKKKSNEGKRWWNFFFFSTFIVVVKWGENWFFYPVMYDLMVN